jgi:hypothetical protein
LPARPAALMLGRTDFFLFWHGEMESIVEQWPDACAVSSKIANFSKKMRFVR